MGFSEKQETGKWGFSSVVYVGERSANSREFMQALWLARIARGEINPSAPREEPWDVHQPKSQKYTFAPSAQSGAHSAVTRKTGR